MPTGSCRLCHKTDELQDSHLLPKALYKLLNKTAEKDGEKNTNPVIVTPKIALQTSKQFADHLLCKKCETRLNHGGEKWVVENCWHADDDYPLRTALETAKPVHIGKSGLHVYEGASIEGVDTAKLVHFAAGVFWRAGAHQWGATAGHKPVKLDLGPYEEQLRLFILGEAEFPRHIVLLVTASSDPEANEIVLFPFLRSTKGGFRQYMFAIPGVTFQLFVGRAIPKNLRQGCTARSANHLVFLGSNDFAIRDMTKLVMKAQPKGGLG